MASVRSWINNFVVWHHLFLTMNLLPKRNWWGMDGISVGGRCASELRTASDHMASQRVWAGACLKISLCMGPRLQPDSYWCRTAWTAILQPLSHVWHCNPRDCSAPGFPVVYCLPELAQTHVHRVGDAIQPSHPLSSPSPPAFSLSQHQGLFQHVGSLHQVAKYWHFSFSISASNEYSGLISFRIDC